MSEGQRAESTHWKSVLRYDVPASLVVFLVALPLSLGIAVASNAPVLAGLIAAVVGGIVAGCLGGSPLQVSGPAAGLTVIVAGLVGQFGWAVTCAITVCAGLLQVLFGLSRIARAALAIAPVVVYAMLAGIGVTIALQQLHVLLGGEAKSSALTSITELPAQLLEIEGAGLLLGLAVIAVLVMWPWVPAPVGKVPGPLVAIVGVTMASVVLGLDVSRIEIGGSLLEALQLPELPDGNWGAFAVGVLTVALIASVESLLSAVSVDRLGGTQTNFDRELLGQGSANIASGALGGLPITGVIVRSSTNVAAGARTRASAILHGVWLLVFALPFVGLIQQIPSAALAGLLIVIGCQLVKWPQIKTAHRTGDLAVYLVTILGVVFVNLLAGVLIGLGLAVSLVLSRVVRTRIRVEPTGDGQWRVVVVGSLTFLSLPQLTRKLASLPSSATVTLELSVDFLDHPCQESIAHWQRQHEAKGGAVHIHELGSVDMDSALQGPPQRALDSPTGNLAGVLPWSSWQRNGTRRINGSGTNGNGSTPQPIMDGLAEYQRRTAPVIRPHLRGLAHAQRPETLFITCADSRVVPNVITSSGPGDLFTFRNVGNLVPPNRGDASVEAAITFAVEHLSISSIVVCGHSGCGAMTALLSAPTNGSTRRDHDDPLRSWLRYGQHTVVAFREGQHPVARSAAAAGFSAVDQLSMVNVAVQLETLRQHPVVERACREAGLHVSGLFYDIASATVLRVFSTHVEALTFETTA
ncbi:bifunctional SulP family inorganic anion transporter/carbonic anhydrase [Mycolicibacterium sp. ND9-15]|uniref:bifunctional SulP family inorganic anion transporter/carbonic anhydrase n=1 Tax=Mycolicibacterium sp. ND9-15 TaxID=3042320 RepID=UPI002DD951AE|nr:bifunctional SulP family inorganic anion transporter/carbonic anhydrase [Mycolicibacterium sp. ND9-15]WSE56518.1 bifunctional SulP family inorganic anion transporter/carbonic anhydrase [Mycolicibacterium sp. ND9-15]